MFLIVKLQEEKMQDRNKRIVKIIFFALAVVFLIVVGWVVGKPMVMLASEPDKFRDWVEELGFLGELAYIGMLIFQIVFAIIPGEPFEIVAGYAFGAIKGTVLCCIGTTLGSIVVFILVRTFGKRVVELFFSYDKINEAKFLKRSKRRDLVSFLIFLLPGTPKDLLVYFLGLTKIDFITFLIVVAIGRIPSIVTSTVGGNALGKQDYLMAIVTFAVTILVSITGYIIYQTVLARHKNKKEK